MHLSTFTRRTAGALAATALGAGSLAVAAPANATVVNSGSDNPKVGYLAQAYGSYINTEDGNISSGPTGYTGLACTTQGGRESSNNTAKTDVPGIAHVGATETLVKSIDKGKVDSSLSKSRIAGASALGHLVKIGALTSKSQAIKGPDGYSADQSSKIASLSVAGQDLDVSASPNSRIKLSLPVVGTIGYIDINKQEDRMVGDEYRVATTALHIAILDDAKVSMDKATLSKDGKTLKLHKASSDAKTLSLTSGTHIRLGVTRSHLQPPELGYLTGNGFGTRVEVLGGVVESGPTSPASLPCTGGASHNSVASVNLPGLAKVDGVKTHAEGSVDSDPIHGTVTSETGKISLLDGAITADAIKAVANASRPAHGDAVTLSDEGSQLVGLKINGKPIADVDVKPNTSLKVGDLAEVTLHKVTKSSTKISVTQIEIKLLKDTANLKAGATVEVAHAAAGVN